MYFQIVEIHQIPCVLIENCKTYEEADCHVIPGRLIAESYVVIDNETAEKYGIESEITAKQLFEDEIEFYKKEELDRNLIEKCTIVNLEELERRRIDEIDRLISENIFNTSYAIKGIAIDYFPNGLEENLI